MIKRSRFSNSNTRGLRIARWFIFLAPTHTLISCLTVLCTITRFRNNESTVQELISRTLRELWNSSSFASVKEVTCIQIFQTGAEIERNCWRFIVKAWPLSWNGRGLLYYFNRFDTTRRAPSRLLTSKSCAGRSHEPRREEIHNELGVHFLQSNSRFLGRMRFPCFARLLLVDSGHVVAYETRQVPIIDLDTAQDFKGLLVTYFLIFVGRTGFLYYFGRLGLDVHCPDSWLPSLA